ncbi:hypothetical protein OROGR_005644 [Orobanche gracilis]
MLGNSYSGASGSHGQIGVLQKHNIGFAQQNQEFSIQNEDFPALPGYKGEIWKANRDWMVRKKFPGRVSAVSPPYTAASRRVRTRVPESGESDSATATPAKCPCFIAYEFRPESEIKIVSTSSGSCHYNLNGRLIRCMMGRASGLNFGGSYSSHHPQQHGASSINGTGGSYLTSGSQDLHFHGPDYPQFQQSHSRLISIIKMVNPALTSLALGIDLTTLGLNLNSSETLHKKFASPWSDEPIRGDPEYNVPECYHAKQRPPLKRSYFARFRPETLFFIFYSMPKDEAQLFAANELITIEDGSTIESFDYG